MSSPPPSAPTPFALDGTSPPGGGPLHRPCFPAAPSFRRARRQTLSSAFPSRIDSENPAPGRIPIPHTHTGARTRSRGGAPTRSPLRRTARSRSSWPRRHARISGRPLWPAAGNVRLLARNYDPSPTLWRFDGPVDGQAGRGPGLRPLPGRPRRRSGPFAGGIIGMIMSCQCHLHCATVRPAPSSLACIAA